MSKGSITHSISSAGTGSWAAAIDLRSNGEATDGSSAVM